MTIHILAAQYGIPGTLADVTEAVRQLLRNADNKQNGSATIDNGSMGGDPAYGRKKQLTVVYSVDGALPQTEVFTEGGKLELGAGAHRLGVAGGSF